MTVLRNLPEDIELQARITLSGDDLATFIDANYVVGYIEVDEDGYAFEIGGRYFLVLRSSPAKRDFITVSDISNYDIMPLKGDGKVESLVKPGEIIFVGMRHYLAIHQ